MRRERECVGGDKQEESCNKKQGRKCGGGSVMGSEKEEEEAEVVEISRS